MQHTTYDLEYRGLQSMLNELFHTSGDAGQI